MPSIKKPLLVFPSPDFASRLEETDQIAKELENIYHPKKKASQASKKPGNRKNPIKVRTPETFRKIEETEILTKVRTPETSENSCQTFSTMSKVYSIFSVVAVSVFLTGANVFTIASHICRVVSEMLCY